MKELFHNRRGGAQTNAPLILSIFSFYIILIFLCGLIGGSTIHSSAQYAAPGEPTTNPLTIYGYIGLFFGGLAFSIAEMGIFNIIWLPLILTVAYIIASWVRGSS